MLDHPVDIPCSLLIQVTKKGQPIASSQCEGITQGSDNASEALIRAARNSLFEEELFHEILKECRVLGSYDITIRDSIIQIPLSGLIAGKSLDGKDAEEQIEISLTKEKRESRNSDQDKWAQMIATFLRLMFCQAQRQKIRQRAELPRPMTEGKNKIAPLALLCPLINHLQHYNASKAAGKLLRSIQTILGSAKIHLGLSFAYDLALSEFSPLMKMDDSSLSDALMKYLMSPLTGEMTILLPSLAKDRESRGLLKISIRTHLASPTVGTTFHLTVPSLLAVILFSEGPKSKTMNFDSLAELQNYIVFLLEIDIAHHLVTMIGDRWIPTDRWPELFKVNKTADQKQKITIKLSPQKFTMLIQSTESMKASKSYSWDGSGTKPTFEDIVINADNFTLS